MQRIRNFTKQTEMSLRNPKTNFYRKKNKSLPESTKVIERG